MNPPPLPEVVATETVVKPLSITRRPPAGHKFPCHQCGAKLNFDPASQALLCPYCGYSEAIAPSTKEVQERDWEDYWEHHAVEEGTVAGRSSEVRCDVCGAIVLLEDKIASSDCPYCRSHIENQPEAAHSMIPPGAILPFTVTLRDARQSFLQWISSRWFAPSTLYKLANLGQLSGVYAPFWTFDSMTCNQYTGARGDNFIVTETYTDRDAQGNPVTRTRQVVHVRWTPVSGEVRHFFDDVLTYASHSLPNESVGAMYPWELGKVVVYQEEYLSGFQTERYTVGLREGFDEARAIMDRKIRMLCAQDIGGDHQRLDHVDTQHVGITFKSVLMPMWVAAYRYHNKLFRILINGRTGRVVGDRPYSTLKIVLFVLAIAALLAVLFWLFNRSTEPRPNPPAEDPRGGIQRDVEIAYASTRFRPAFLAAYSLASARWIKSSGVMRSVPSVPATPMLTVTRYGLPSNSNGRSAIAARSRSAHSLATGVAVSGSTTTNSSPPYRAMSSPFRASSLTQAASSRSVRSPARWPIRSLIDLK
jgi:DNA-directed RNA polymerase subunit RPC12/RpoP